jgi:hypothetical protein
LENKILKDPKRGSLPINTYVTIKTRRSMQRVTCVRYMA